MRETRDVGPPWAEIIKYQLCGSVRLSFSSKGEGEEKEGQ